MKRWFCAGVLAMAVGAGTGCPRTAPMEAEPVEDDPIPLRERLEQLTETGQTGAAIELLETALTNSAYADDRPAFFRQILGLHLNAGEIEPAQGRYYSALSEPDLMKSGFGLIENRLTETGQFGLLATWSDNLRRTETLPMAKREQAAHRQLEAYRLGAMPDKAVALVPALLSEFESAAAERLLKRHLDRLLEMDIPAFDVFLATLEQRGADPAWLSPLTTVYRLKLAVARRHLAEAADGFAAALSTLADAGHDGTALLRSIVRLGRETGMLARADALCERVATRAPRKSALRQEAAAHSVRLAVERALRPRLVLGRLDRALAETEPVIRKLALTRDTLYDVMERGSRWNRRRMLALCEELLAAAESEHERGDAIGLLLDACFLTERFERALELVQAGIPGMTDDSQAILIVKVKAHHAMDKNRHEEAIGYFREFMDRIQAADRWESEGVDPYTGLKVSREEVLALNAERIAGLWRTLRQPEKAAEAMEEARGHLRDALARLPADSEEHRAARQKLDKLEAK